MKNFLQRFLFALLSAITMVFFSEKAYWYPQGYAIGELILFYLFPVFTCLWAIERFRVRKISAIILIAALYAFLVEGVLTSVIYEAGLLDPVMPAYFIGWHGLLSVIFGWYYIRKWLLCGAWKKLLVGGTLFGVFWGIWSLTYWLPENIAEFEQLPAAGEHFLSGIWTISEFALHSLTFSLMLIFAHWLLGRGIWQASFNPSKIEKWIALLGLAFFFSASVLPFLPLAIFKLAFMLAVVFFALRLNRRREMDKSLLAELTGTVKFRHTLTLLTMPFAATLVYSLATATQLSEEFLRSLSKTIPLLQWILGGGVFVWALIAVFWNTPKAQTGVTS